MERLGDDEISSIFNRICNSDDLKSFFQVSKQFMRVACIRLIRLDTLYPAMLYDILPASPNLVRLLCHEPLLNSHMKLLAQSCPKLMKLLVNLRKDFKSSEFDFDDDGFCVLVNVCTHLEYVRISRRINVGDVGIHSLLTSCKNLRYLNLDGCVSVTDESLKAIGESSSLVSLCLGGCYLITDLGLKYLANGSGDVKNCLSFLDLAKCGKISDDGIVALLSQLPNIQVLDMSWLTNITNISLFVIASKCLKLREICLIGCKAITGEGLHAFSHHPTIYVLN